MKRTKIISLVLAFAIALTLFTACSVRKVNGDGDKETTDSIFDVTETDKVTTSYTETETETDTEAVTETESETIVTTPPQTEPPQTEPPQTESPQTTPPQTQPPQTTPPQTTPPQTEPPQTKPVQAPSTASGDCLFIGDSRTVGLQLYSGLKVDYFANVGMSIYSIGNATAEVNGMGKVNFDQLMNSKQYKRIFIMLGINEIGYPIASSAAKYKALIDNIKAKQPDAAIFIQANIHVSKERSDSDPVINNPALNKYNAELAKLADNTRVFYLDANFLFDDAAGNLSSEKSSDGVHFYAKDYIPWAEWLMNQSASLMG